DYEIAAGWFARAAQQGVADAQNNLGVIFANGFAGPKDYGQAHLWFSLAAAQGHAQAEASRQRVARRMSESQIAAAEQQRVRWLADRGLRTIIPAAGPN
ncbi:MAG: hypothetical protein ACTSX7_05855, partial [Alphaproteobacteria bacterium]